MAFAVALLGSLAMTANAWAVGPFFEDFESEPTCTPACATICALSTSGFVNVDETLAPISQANNRDWLVDTAGTVSSATGPSADHTLGTSAGKYLFLETSSPCDTQVYEVNLDSPPLDIGTLTTPAVRFWYHLFGGSIGELHVDVLDTTGNVLQLDVTPPVIGPQGNLWIQTPLIDLTGFQANAQVVVRIRALHFSAGLGFEGDQAIDDFEFLDAVNPDASLVSVDSPSTGCNLTATESVTVTIENRGLNAIANVPIQYTVDGGAPVQETFAGPLMPGMSASFTFATTVDLSAGGSVDIDVTIAAPNDFDTSNDMVGATVVNTIGTTYTVPISEDFEGATATTGWISYDRNATSNSWLFGAPNNAVINSASSGTQAYYFDGYPNDEESALQIACPFDLSALTDPAVSLDIWTETESCCDGASLQYSIDNGETWVTVGTSSSATPGENWYNDASASGLNTDNNDAWTGSSSGYFTASHSLAAIAGETSVLLRIAFGSDGSGIDEGVAIDNFVVAEAAGIFPAESVVTQVVAETLPTINGLHETHGPFPVLVLDFDQPLGPVTLDSITVTNAGSIMDADIFWHLFADDGDGFFDISVDTQLAAMIAQSGGSATLSTGGTALPSFDTQRFFIVAELAVNAMPGNTIVASVAANTDIVFAGTPTTTLSAPYTADTVTLNPVISTFPFEDDFSVFDPSFTGLDGEGTKLQTANEVGPVGNPTDYGNDGFITLVTSQGNLLPVSGTSFLQLDYDSLAGQAFQYAFDMSAFSVANNEHIWVGFRWSHTGDENDPEENVFLSLDGGSSYLGSVYHFEKNSGNDEVWNEDFIDLFDVLNAASLDYTDNIVIRWQGNDETAIPADGMYFDRIQVGFPPELVLERSATVFLDGDTDAQGSIPALPQSVTYNVANGGDLDLVLDAGGFTVANEMGVSNVTVTQPANLTVPNGAMETLVVDFEPALGAFSFDLTVPTNGPSLTGSSYTITISGTATTPAPDISVERPAGTEIASGSTDGQGDQPVEMAQELVYTIVNTGNIDLNLQGINVLNAANTTAALTVAPMGVLAPTETTTFAVSYTPTAAGPFSFEVSIGNDDPDESPYVIIVEGDGTDTSGVGGGGPTTTTGAGGSGGDGGAGGDADGDDDGSDDDGGCSCSTPGSSRSQAPPTSLLVFGGMLVVAARRRRRR